MSGQAWAWGRCPMACGAVVGKIQPEGHQYAGWVKLAPHVFRLSPELNGPGKWPPHCIGTGQPVKPLPLAAPAQADIDAQAERLAEANNAGLLFTDAAVTP